MKKARNDSQILNGQISIFDFPILIDESSLLLSDSKGIEKQLSDLAKATRINLGGGVKMQSNFEQIKLNIPKQDKQIIEYCKELSAQRRLSATVVRLLDEERRRTEQNTKQPFFSRFKRKNKTDKQT